MEPIYKGGEPSLNSLPTCTFQTHISWIYTKPTNRRYVWREQYVQIQHHIANISIRRLYGWLEGPLGGVTDTVGKTVGGVTDTLGSTVDDLGKTAGGATEGLGHTASGATGGIGHTTEDAGQAVQGTVQGVGGQKQDEDNPLGLNNA